ncbi:MAG TPA: thymidylate kinase, partial [Stellaceae bacterium]|nr:thymidylate kinase [Stellaceae bacterium]
MGQALSRGRFITLEGGEGAGKSTHAKLLVEALQQAGQAAVRTREPGGARGAEEIRRLLVEGPPQRWDG